MDLGYVVLAMTKEKDHPEALFSIDIVLEDDLNKNIVSERLKEEFETKEKPLSKDAIVTKKKDGKWMITDKGEKVYIVKKENEKLNIYTTLELLYSGSPNEWKPFPFYTKNDKIIPIEDIISDMKRPIMEEYKVRITSMTDKLEDLTDDFLCDLRETSIIYVIDCFSLGIQSIKDVAETINETTDACLIILSSDYPSDLQDELRKKLKKHLKYIYISYYDRSNNDLIKEALTPTQFKNDLVAAVKNLIELSKSLDVLVKEGKPLPRPLLRRFSREEVLP